MRKLPFLGSFAMAAALAVPAIIATATLQAQRAVVVRVYDRDHKDYHHWDGREDRAYRGYMVEQRRDYRIFRRLKRPEQRLYWKWRHEHPDHDNRR